MDTGAETGPVTTKTLKKLLLFVKNALPVLNYTAIVSDTFCKC